MYTPSNPTGTNVTHVFDWKLYPEAESFLEKHIRSFLKNNRFALSLAARMENETSTLFRDWIDHIILSENTTSKKEIEELGFQETDSLEAPAGIKVFTLPGSVFFPVLLSQKSNTEVVLKTERIDHFIQAIGKNIPIDGVLFGHYRKAVISEEDGHLLSAAERRGYNGYCIPERIYDMQEYLQALDVFSCRQRFFEDQSKGIVATQQLVETICKTITPARATDAFFRTERMYWERRNWTAQIQKARQDRLGLGWGNHDHHTYRSSRKNISLLLHLFETLGFLHRERFYAGEEAGWGAQILEHPHGNIVLFTDLDLLHGEKDVDFTRPGLKQAVNLGTVGLWVALHGESILQAGLHHLAARSIFEKIRIDLEKHHLFVMKPFSYFPFLKQAFSEGEIWRIEKKYLDHLVANNLITETQYDIFHKNGAIGSHLENIQRAQGFKGFNQHSVSVIIETTDPRTYKS